ncbi:MAG: pyrroline-5-carboxylate reductase dimerization domain-containing protein [Bacteroidales bacterium]
MNIAVIGGGNMGGAIAAGFASNGVVPASSITVSHPKSFVEQMTGMTLTRDNKAAVKDADIIILAVKPSQASSVLTEIAPALKPFGQELVSVVSGLSFAELRSFVGEDMPLYHIIPNTAISIGKSVTFVASDKVGSLSLERLCGMLQTLGEVFVVTEKQLPAVAALSSCGIAYALRYLDAAAKGGNALGLDPQITLDIVLGTMEGAIALLKTNSSEPQSEIDKVTTPGGITLKGLAAMEDNGFSASVLAGLKASK